MQFFKLQISQSDRGTGSDTRLASNLGHKEEYNNDNNNKKVYPPADKLVDKFDDSCSIPKETREEILSNQRKLFSTTLDAKHRISPTVPSYIPKNYPQTQLSAPTLEVSNVSSLSSLRVVSQETYGQVSTIGSRRWTSWHIWYSLHVSMNMRWRR